MRATALLVAGALLALTGCGGGSSGEAPATKVHEVAEHGFSIAVPSDWKTLTPGEALSANELQEFRDDNPEVAPYLDAVSAPDSPIKFLALDPRVKDAFATNVNVVALPASGGVSFDRWAKAAATEANNLPSRSGPLEQERVNLPAGEALRLAYDQSFSFEGEERTVATLQYALVGASRSYVLTFTTPSAQEADYLPIFRAAAESFRISD